MGSDFTDTNLLCIQKDPWAAKNPGQASSSYCQGDTESGNFPGRSKYVGCYHGGVEKETLERCQKECDTKTWIPPFIKKTSCWGRVADNYNHQRSGKKSLPEAITEMEGVCGECTNECEPEMFDFGHDSDPSVDQAALRAALAGRGVFSSLRATFLQKGV